MKVCTPKLRNKKFVSYLSGCLWQSWSVSFCDFIFYILMIHLRSTTRMILYPAMIILLSHWKIHKWSIKRTNKSLTKYQAKNLNNKNIQATYQVCLYRINFIYNIDKYVKLQLILITLLFIKVITTMRLKTNQNMA